MIVEDDPKLGPLLQADLRKNGYAVDLTPSAIDGEFMGMEIAYDIIILDIGLPEKNGIDILKSWRSKGLATPVIILSARSSWEEKVSGFEAGADDYLAKPFHFEELLQRLSAIIRRSLGKAPNHPIAKSILLDEARQSITLEDGTKHPLTGTEFRLLRYMMMNAGKILSKSQLTDHVYSDDADKDSNVIEVYIRRLRHKIPDDMITTKRGQGYIFKD